MQASTSQELRGAQSGNDARVEGSSSQSMQTILTLESIIEQRRLELENDGTPLQVNMDIVQLVAYLVLLSLK